MIESKPALLLLPNLLGEMKHHEPFLPNSVDKAVSTLDGLIAESPTLGRRFLKRFNTKKPAEEIPIALLNEHTPDDHIDFLLDPIAKGERWGLVSDAGLPCVADPGYLLVRRARQRGMIVQAFVGPSSMMMALMLSGLPGQKFTFYGYLEKDAAKRKRQIEEMERMKGMTHIFMEAPYRNDQMIEQLVQVLHDETHLCVAWDLTMSTQGVLSQPVRLWKKSPLPNLDKKNAVFLFA